MILLLCGASGTGKDTIRKELVENYGYENIPIYTNRPMRSNEKNGIDYQFVPIEVFEQLEQNDFFCETSSFSVYDNKELWKYGTPKDVFEPNGNDLRIMITNPSAITNFSNIVPRTSYCVCQLTATPDTIKKRLKERGDDRGEIIRRMKADIDDFYDLRFDIIIPNDDEPLEKIAFDVDMYYRCWKAGKENE